MPNQNAVANVNTEILCRIDAAKRAPVLFFPATIDNGAILGWMDGKEEIFPLEYYHMTAPMTAADEKVIAERYAAAARISPADVRIRHRLPRTPRDRVSLLAPNAAPAPAANAPQQRAPLQLAVNNAPAPAPQAPANNILAGLSPEALQALAAVAAQHAPLVPAAAQVTPPTAAAPVVEYKGRNRRQRGTGRAKPIEAQDAPAGAPVEPGLTLATPAANDTPAPEAPHVPAPAVQEVAAATPGIAQVTPGEVMQAIINLGNEFNSRLNQLLEALTPATQK